ncbi:MAG: hypothetical protein QNJ30_25745 [Kiloniellales bacterium]|nr:hypothetical protein [Kiloniellales bacterium]
MGKPADVEAARAVIRRDWRYYTGLTFLGLAMVMPLFGILVLPLDLSIELKAFILGALSIGGPEVALVIAAAFLGKDTLAVFTSRFFAFLRKLLPTKPTSQLRYYTCITVMMAVYLGWYVYGYFGDFLPQELTGQSALVVGDLAFVTAFLAAGPEFWEKIGRIFRWEGRLQQEG